MKKLPKKKKILKISSEGDWFYLEKLEIFLDTVLDFDRVEGVDLEGSLMEEDVISFLSKFKKIKKLSLKLFNKCVGNPTFSENLFVWISENFADEMEELEMKDIRISAAALDMVLRKCNKLRRLGIDSLGTSQLSCLAGNPFAHQLEHLTINSRVLENLNSKEKEEEKEKLFCRFLRNCGTNLRGLSLIDCSFVSSQSMKVISEYCPNFDSLEISNPRLYNPIFTPIPFSAISNIAEKCAHFPSKLMFFMSREHVIVTPGESQEFKEKYFCRLKFLSLDCWFDSSNQHLADFFNLENVEEIEFRQKNFSSRTLAKEIPKLKKLKRLVVDVVNEGEEEICSKSLKELVIVNDNNGVTNLNLPNLTKMKARFSNFVVKSNRRLHFLSFAHASEGSDIAGNIKNLRPEFFFPQIEYNNS